MPRKPPKYKQLGLTKTKNGYLSPSGDYISNRQYKKLVGTPLKGSQGYKERQAAKTRGEDFRATPEAMKEFSKRRGATSEWFKTGKEPELPASVQNVQDTHFKALNKQRLDAIAFKEQTGAITPKQAEKLREEFREEHYQRGVMAKLYEQLNNNSERPGGRMLTNEERRRKERQYQQARRKYDKARAKLEGSGILPDKYSSLYEGYYHSKSKAA